MKERSIRVYKSQKDNRRPAIILQGKWLQDIGYAAGDYLSVIEEEGKIIISIREKYIPEERRRG